MSEKIEQQNAADGSLSDENLESVSGGLSIGIERPILIEPIVCPLPEPVVCWLPDSTADQIVNPL